MSQQIISPTQEWIRILDKGMITIPKQWREELGFTKGSFIKASKNKDAIIFEPLKKPAPYRVYNQKELLSFIAKDAPKKTPKKSHL